MNYETLCLPHRAYLLSCARRFTNHPEDLVQETYLKALARWDSFAQKTDDVERDVRAWLGRILTNTAYNHYTHDKKGIEVFNNYGAELELENEESPDPATEDEYNTRVAFEKLSPIYRDVLYLNDVEGKTYVEITKILNIPLGTVQSRVHRARAQLKKSLAGLVDTSAFKSTKSTQTEEGKIICPNVSTSAPRELSPG